MTRWRPTPALSRALVVAALAVVTGVLTGTAVVIVVAAPLVVCGAMAMLHRPDTWPLISSVLEHRSLGEGQGTTARLRIDGDEDVEYVARIMAPSPYLALHPITGAAGRCRADGLPEIEIGPRRWGWRELGEQKVGLVAPWAGYRWGPVDLPPDGLRVRPQMARFDSRAQPPRPAGLVGAHPARRQGPGSEFADIRPFRAGDRLRRINWRVSARTDELYVTVAPAEQDSGVLLVVDALADHGRSDGLDGAASSLDLTVRAAAALATHHVREGDRVSLRVVGAAGQRVGSGTGARHLRRVLDVLSGLRPGPLPEDAADRIQLRVTAGTIVFVLSPMLSPAMGTATASLISRGLQVVVIDTLPPDAWPAVASGADAALAGLAWRMRRLERGQILAGLAALGCPVARWRGPGTVDDVLRRLQRRGPQRAVR